MDIHGKPEGHTPVNRPGCTRPVTHYDINSKHMGCTDEWCCAEPMAKTVDSSDREQMRRIVLGHRFRRLRLRPGLQRAWDRVK